MRTSSSCWPATALQPLCGHAIVFSRHVVSPAHEHAEIADRRTANEQGCRDALIMAERLMEIVVLGQNDETSNRSEDSNSHQGIGDAAHTSSTVSVNGPRRTSRVADERT
jgi:hypothetical protein